MALSQIHASSPLWRFQPPPQSSALCRLERVEAILQCQSFWCWAAVMQELYRLYGVVKSQCDIVKLIKGCDCEKDKKCHPERRDKCNDRYDLAASMSRRGSVQADYRAYPQFKVSDVCQHLRDRQPVVAVFAKGTQYHYVLVRGLQRADPGWLMELADPSVGHLVTIAFVDNGTVTHRRCWSLSGFYLLRQSVSSQGGRP